MTPSDRRMNHKSSRPSTPKVGGFLTLTYALLGCMQLVQPVFTASAADVLAVNQTIARTPTGAVANATQDVAVQRSAAATMENGAKVAIINFAFAPAEITITPCESVTWTNDDGAPHGLEYQDGAKGTDLLLPGASFTRRFDRPGTYDYHCSVHPYMTGRVVVRAK